MTPLVKSGDYQIQVTEARGDGGTIALATNESITYETAFYAILKFGRGVRLEFVSAEMTRDGLTSPEAAPNGWQPQLPSGPNLVRLLYIQRLSQDDHDMAIIAANNKAALDALARGACNMYLGPGRRCGGW